MKRQLDQVTGVAFSLVTTTSSPTMDVHDTNHLMQSFHPNGQQPLVSSVFHPHMNIGSYQPDLLFISSDGIFFFVHKHRLLDASANNFNHQLVETAHNSNPLNPQMALGDRNLPCVALPEHSLVLNIVLHSAYGVRDTRFLRKPSLEEICCAVDSLQKYGFTPLSRTIPASSTLFRLLVEYAFVPKRASWSTGGSVNAETEQRIHKGAICVYRLAACYDMHELAVTTSQFLLSMPINFLPDEDAQQIGGLYVKRLASLHIERTQALKALVLEPPLTTSSWFAKCSSAKHSCAVSNVDEITRAWSLAVAYIMVNEAPDLDEHALESVLRPPGDNIECVGCKRLWAERTYDVVSNYAKLKVNIHRFVVAFALTVENMMLYSERFKVLHIVRDENSFYLKTDASTEQIGLAS